EQVGYVQPHIDAVVAAEVEAVAHATVHHHVVATISVGHVPYARCLVVKSARQLAPVAGGERGREGIAAVAGVDVRRPGWPVGAHELLRVVTGDVVDLAAHIGTEQPDTHVLPATENGDTGAVRQLKVHATVFRVFLVGI